MVQIFIDEKQYYVEDGIIEFKNNTLSILTSYIFNLKDIEKICERQIKIRSDGYLVIFCLELKLLFRCQTLPKVLPNLFRSP